MEFKENRLALFNVTSLIDKNPGCKATILGLKKAIDKEFKYQFPLGIGYENFEIKKRIFLNNKLDFSKKYLKFKTNSDYIKTLESVDCIIINSEGTIHSNSIGAQTLLAFVKLGKELGKQVYLVNGSYYNLDNIFLDVLKTADAVLVREKKSNSYLTQNNVNSTLIPDCAFLTDFRFSNFRNNSCLYTPGVIFSYGKESANKNIYKILASHFKTINKKYEKPTFLLVDEKERNFAEFWTGMGGYVLDSTSLDIETLLEKMSEFELVVSGRYHILLFALMCKLKTVPLSSNTDKIEGLYFTFDYKKNNFIQNCLTDDLNIDEPIGLNLDLEEIRSNILLNYKKIFGK